MPAVSIDTPTPTVTATPSPSPIWFPATETPTPAPTITPRPTENNLAGLGALTLQDDFSEKDAWRTGDTANGRIQYGVNELTLAVTAPKASLSSLRAGELPGDAFLEITARPALCRGGDIYGLLFRSASERDAYRLMATCDGQLRLERLRNGEVALMQDWTPSGQLPNGGMLSVRLGVWMLGRDLRIFVNGEYQFGARDPVFEGGTLGVYARSAADSPLTVSFSDLRVYAIDPSLLPSATPTPSPTP